jgi:hypothetical protein
MIMIPELMQFLMMRSSLLALLNNWKELPYSLKFLGANSYKFERKAQFQKVITRNVIFFHKFLFYYFLFIYLWFI